MVSQRRIWLNGRPGPAGSPSLAVTDRGFRFGDGVFEVFRARRGVLIEWPHHAARLRRGAAALAITLPWADDELADWSRALLEAEGLAGAGGQAGTEPGDAVLRITVSRGPRDDPGLAPGDDDSAPTVVVEAWPYEAPPPRALDQGVTTIEAAGRRDPAAPLAGVRSLSCADRVAAQLQVARAGADDGLLLTPDGCLVESTSACIFIVRDARLVTPPLAAGVEPQAIRAWLLRDPAVQAIGLAPAEAAVRPEDLLATDEAFLADDVAGIVPLVAHEGRPIGGGRPGLRSLALRAAREAWIDRVSRGEVVDAATVPGLLVPAAEPAAAEPAAAEPESGGRPLEPATLPEGTTEAASVHVAVPTRSSLLARSAALPSSERAALGPDQVYGWAAALAPAEVLLLGRVVHEMLRTGSPPEAGRAFGIAWWGGARLPRHDQESMIKEFADLEVTIGSVLAGRDLRDVRPVPKRGLAALFDFFPSRSRESESQAFSAIELAGEPAHLGLIALWNAWVAVRYRALIPPPTVEMLVRPWVTVVGPLPGPSLPDRPGRYTAGE